MLIRQDCLLMKYLTFKGNSLTTSRRLLSDYKNQPDWKTNPTLDSETFGTATAYDALNRMVQMTAPDGSIFRAAV